MLTLILQPNAQFNEWWSELYTLILHQKDDVFVYRYLSNTSYIQLVSVFKTKVNYILQLKQSEKNESTIVFKNHYLTFL